MGRSRTEWEALLKSDLSYVDIANQTQTRLQTVKKWASVLGLYHKRGRGRPKRSIDPERILPEMLRLRQEGKSVTEIAKACGVSRSYITHAARRFNFPLTIRRLDDWMVLLPLIEQRFAEGKLAIQIAAELGVQVATLSKALIRMGAPTASQRPGFAEEHAERGRRLAVYGMPYRKVSKAEMERRLAEKALQGPTPETHGVDVPVEKQA